MLAKAIEGSGPFPGHQSSVLAVVDEVCVSSVNPKFLERLQPCKVTDLKIKVENKLRQYVLTMYRCLKPCRRRVKCSVPFRH